MGAACKILVVEDEAIIAMDLAQQLEGFGYAVAGVAHSAADAVAQAHHVSPDLVLMDIVLRGGEDGITAAHRIGADLRIPIIYLTAYSDGATVARAAQTGPYGYLTKPFEPRQVRAAVEIALAKAELERELLESRQWLAATLHSVGDGVVATDVDGRVRLLNPVAAFLAGIDEAAAAGRDVAEVLRLELPEDTTDGEHPVLRALARDECTGIPFGTRLLHADGGAVAIDDSVAPIRRPDGSLAGAVMVFRDVSERLRLEESLRASERHFQSAFMQAATGIAVVDLEGRIVLANPALDHLLGRADGETVGGEWDAVLHPEFRAAGRKLRDALAAGAARDSQLEVCIRRVEGATPWVLVSGAAVHDAAGRPQAFVYHVHDIDERKRAEARLEWLAHFDPLTGLANRARLQFEAERTLAAARRSGTQVALLFLDLDHFKRINDTLGHDAGDRLLREVGDRLRAATRTSDIVARLGGDEFVVLVEEVGRPEAALTVADKLRESVARPVWLDGQELKLTASVGVCLFPGDGDDIGALLRNADSALYHAKSQGRDTVAFYREEFTARTGERLRIEQALHRALEAREFVLHYQPVVELATGEVIGVEALLRWQRGGRLEAPATFVPALEESGLILAVGAWVLQEACRQARVWRDAGVPPLNIAVNISARQLRDPALDLCVTAALAAARLPAQRLCLEITETLLSDIGEVELATLEGLRNLGVTVAIDDFGVGYSSLSYLKHFKPRSLKIDRSFIVDVATDDTDAAIVSATIAMAHRLGIRVVAEGVETAPQLEFLRGEGCDAVQGFLLARPMPAEAIPALAASRLPPAPGA